MGTSALPSMVQGQSPVMGFGGRSLPEALIVNECLN